MTIDDAAKILQKKYAQAPEREKVVNIHLFGIEHGEKIGNLPLKELVARAGLPNSYATEIRKGISLSKYVELRQTP